MDKLTTYRQIARTIVQEVHQKSSSTPDFESIISIDEEGGHYLILSDGWEGIERTYGPLIHIDVKSDAKVWLRYDGTDLEIGQELLDKGVAPTDLVLAFYSPQMRKYTHFAAA